MQDASRATGKDRIGQILAGRFRLVRELGSGGMGCVFEAEQLPLGRRVAVKVLHTELQNDASRKSFQERFLLEASTCARLNHPNVVTVFDYGRAEDGSFFMSMEFLDGSSLYDVMKARVLTVEEIVEIASDVTRALRAAHREGVVHRDLKPSNVMLLRSAEGRSVKVVDFGLAKVLQGEQEITKEDVFIGSPRYMSPEQIHRGPIDGRADLYALGVMLYEMLSGSPPFAGETTIQTLMAHIGEPAPPIRARSGAVIPPKLESLVYSLLEKEADSRPKDADAVLTILEGIVQPHRSEVPLPVKERRAAGKARPASFPWKPFSAALVLGGLVAWGVLAASGPSPSQPMRSPSRSQGHSPTSSSEETRRAAADVDPSTASQASASEVTFLVTSEPPAELFVGDQSRGLTPQRIAVASDALERGVACELKKPGYASQRWLQEDGSERNVRLVRQRRSNTPAATPIKTVR